MIRLVIDSRHCETLVQARKELVLRPTIFERGHNRLHTCSDVCATIPRFARAYRHGYRDQTISPVGAQMLRWWKFIMIWTQMPRGYDSAKNSWQQEWSQDNSAGRIDEDARSAGSTRMLVVENGDHWSRMLRRWTWRGCLSKEAELKQECSSSRNTRECLNQKGVEDTWRLTRVFVRRTKVVFRSDGRSGLIGCPLPVYILTQAVGRTNPRARLGQPE